jgi:hypothetical protein
LWYLVVRKIEIFGYLLIVRFPTFAAPCLVKVEVIGGKLDKVSWKNLADIVNLRTFLIVSKI